MPRSGNLFPLLQDTLVLRLQKKVDDQVEGTKTGEEILISDGDLEFTLDRHCDCQRIDGIEAQSGPEQGRIVGDLIRLQPQWQAIDQR